jgi:hypothetical protein
MFKEDREGPPYGQLGQKSPQTHVHWHPFKYRLNRFSCVWSSSARWDEIPFC